MLTFLHAEGLGTFKTIFIGIVLEALPFLLLGVFASSLLQAFIPERWIRRLVPRNPVLGVAVASLLGLAFPVCECGMIPVVRRLLSKGMPLYAGVVFILAGPIVNPIVYASTFAAFQSMPQLVYARIGLALAVSAAVGFLVLLVAKQSPLRKEKAGHVHHVHGDASRLAHSGNRFEEMMKHAGSELFDMGKYLMLGSLITAAVQSFVPRSELVGIGQGEIGSHLFMMGFAYLLSICSTSDAFVASSFLSAFSASSLLAFLVFGPMLDFKGTLMLLSAFKAKFVLFLIVAVAFFVLTGSLFVGRLFF